MLKPNRIDYPNTIAGLVCYKSDLKKYLSKKRKENKAKLVKELKEQLMNQQYEYQDFIWSLVEESLYNRKQKELKQILYGN